MGDVLTKAYDEYAECEKVLSSSAPSHPIANGQKIWKVDGTGPVVREDARQKMVTFDEIVRNYAGRSTQAGWRSPSS